MSTKIRFIHNVYKGPDVVVNLGRLNLMSSLSYKRSSPYFELIGGKYTVEILTKRGKILYTGELNIFPEKAYTSIIHSSGDSGSEISLLFLEDNLQCPTSDKTFIRVIHAAYDVSPVNVFINDKIRYEELSFGNIGNPPYFSIRSGKADFTLVIPGTIRPVAGPYDIDFGSQLIYTMIISGAEYNVSLNISEDSQKVCIKAEE